MADATADETHLSAFEEAEIADEAEEFLLSFEEASVDNRAEETHQCAFEEEQQAQDCEEPTNAAFEEGYFDILAEEPSPAANTSINVSAGDVLERVFASRVFSTRKSFPPWYNVGVRGADQEGPL
jgi:hypothetical protein